MLSFILVSLFTFLIYFPGISHSVYGGDAGDITLANWFGGVAHPPGYPLNTMIGYIFTHLPVGDTVAFRSNLMSAVLQALSVGMVFLTVKKLTKSAIFGLAASLTLAFTPLFWLYGHVTEVFQLMILLVAVSFYLLVLWIDSVLDKKPKKSFLYLSIVFLGLAIFHHQTAILTVPGFIFLILKTDKNVLANFKNIIKLGFLFGIGFLPYIFIPYAASLNTPINWNDPDDLKNFIRLITRADYGTFLASKSFIGAFAKERLAQVASFFLFAKTDFTILGSVLVFSGVFYAYFRRREIFWFLILTIILSGPFFLAYASFALASDFLLGIWERFLLTSYFFLAIFLGFGFVAVHQGLLKFFESLNLFKKSGVFREDVFVLIIKLSFLIFPLTLMLVNWPKTDLAKFYLGDWLGYDVLASSEPDSIIFVYDDTLVFNTQYVYYTNPIYQDRKLVKGGSLKYLEYRLWLRESYPDLIFPENFFEDRQADSATFMQELINANKNRFKIYARGYVPEIEGGIWATTGLLSELFKVDEVEDGKIIFDSINSVFPRLIFTNGNLAEGYRNFIPDHIKALYFESYKNIGNILLSKKYYDDALKFYFIANTIIPESEDYYIGRARVFSEKGDCAGAKNNFVKANSINERNLYVLNQLVKIAKECSHDEAEASKYQMLLDEQQRKLEPTFK
ncbi:DUF2723 domain-containing protein [Candidatus Curtissbacteria bacterium]|nr:DUF2723 domain-containing protein [Candidatus Curtissbacteria bacterium]